MADRWRHIQEFFHRALEYIEPERAAFLDEACAGDDALRREVESLLAKESESGFKETPAMEGEARELAQENRPGLEGRREGTFETLSPLGRGGTGEVWRARDTSLNLRRALSQQSNRKNSRGRVREPASDPAKPVIGGMISHYRIIEKLAEGGMGALYLAEDIRLKRRVALKFLLARALQNPTVRERFIREARASAVLDHPNICAVFEIDEVGEGHRRQTFIAMPYLSGGSLKEKLLEEPVPVSDIIDIVIQVGSGLALAHSHGIVHRDIKPANVMLTDEATPKIVDFGLVLIVGPMDGKELTKLTQEGAVSGTLVYMSPEQARGSKVDHRTDIWSLGVLTYEAVTGRQPFEAVAPHAFLNALVNGQPEPIVDLRPEAPPELDWVVRRAMAKSPDERYQHVEEMVAELEAIRQRTQAGASSVQIGAPKKTAHSIAVLPFRDMSPGRDQGYFCEGIAEEIINALTHVEGLHVASRGSSFQFDKAYDVREVGHKLKVAQVTEGSLRRAGNRLRITAQLTNTSDGYQVWSERFDRDADDIFEIQDEISMGILKKMKVDLVGDEGPVRRYTDNIEAYNLYLKGRYYWNKRTEDGLQRSVEQFKLAIEKDPDFALAFAGLAESYTTLGIYGALPPKEVMPLAREAAEHALDLDPGLAEAHTSLGCVRAMYDWDWDADQDFKRAIEINPRYPNAYNWYASNYLTPLGLHPAAHQQLARARELDPLSLVINASVGVQLYFDRRYDEAVEQYLKVVEMDPSFGIVHYFLGQAYVQKKMTDEAIAELEKAVELTARSPEVVAALGHAHASIGDQDRARALLGELTERSSERYVSPVLLSQVHVGLGDSDSAFECLEQAFSIRSADLIWLKARPVFDPVRNDSRFSDLCARIFFPG